jgi:cytochrome d ubiquinol oxidase subunit I
LDVLTLSRLQFAATTFFHFLFVPLTLGLSVLLAIMEMRYARTGDEDYKKLARFFGRLFLINFAIGVVTGITLEFQFGTNWSRYSEYVGDIFGSLLAIEATATFFLESTFIAVWAFGWKRLSARAHAVCMAIIAFASSMSAVWILIANSWMQHPVGYTIRNGRAELTDFVAVITQKYAYFTIAHTLSGAYMLSGFVVMGISAYHLLRKHNVQIYTKSFKLALTFAFVCSLATAGIGHFKGEVMTHAQPTKLAAAESHWETTTHAPMYLLMIPDPKNERNLVQALPIPSFLSILAKGSPAGEVQGLKDFPKEDRPPVWITFLSFRAMVGLGCLFFWLTAMGLYLVKKDRLEKAKWYLKLMILAIPLPYLALEIGWTLTEVGRQPWIVYGVMRTKDAVSPVHASQVAISLLAFVLIYTLLGILNFYLIVKFAKRGIPAEGGDGHA